MRRLARSVRRLMRRGDHRRRRGQARLLRPPRPRQQHPEALEVAGETFGRLEAYAAGGPGRSQEQLRVVALPAVQPPAGRPDQVVRARLLGRLQGVGQGQPQTAQPQHRQVGPEHLAVQRVGRADLGTGQPEPAGGGDLARPVSAGHQLRGILAGRHHLRARPGREHERREALRLRQPDDERVHGRSGAGPGLGHGPRGLAGQKIGISGIYLLKGATFLAFQDLLLGHNPPSSAPLQAEARTALGRVP
jgi:hypothetical protein